MYIGSKSTRGIDKFTCLILHASLVMANNYGGQMSRGTGHMYLIRSEEIMHNKTQNLCYSDIHVDLLLIF